MTHHFDASTIARLLSPAAAVDAIAAALLDGYDPASDVPRSSMATANGEMLLMPSEIAGYAGVKIATVAPGNPSSGLPRIQASYLLFDSGTLSLRATFDGTALTTLRTPAVAVAAARPALARIGRPARIVIFGSGPQGVGHAETLRAVLGHPTASVTFVARRADEARGVIAAGSPESFEALGAADIVVCATTAREPLFGADSVRPDVIVIAVGSHEPGARELDGALLGRASVIVEEPATALREAGDVVMAIGEGRLRSEGLIAMKDVVGGSLVVPGGAVVVKTVGMSWQDLVVASELLRLA